MLQRLGSNASSQGVPGSVSIGGPRNAQLSSVLSSRAGSEGMRMRRELFYVMNEGGRWNVRHEDQFIGPFASQRAAITDAVSKAKAWRRAGIRSRVLVRGETGSIRTEWTGDANGNAAGQILSSVAASLRVPLAMFGKRP
jgi:hypothetical protein